MHSLTTGCLTLMKVIDKHQTEWLSDLPDTKPLNQSQYTSRGSSASQELLIYSLSSKTQFELYCTTTMR